MSALLATLAVGLSQAALAVIGRVLTQSLFEVVLQKLTVHMLRMLAKSTTNTLDDEIVAEVCARPWRSGTPFSNGLCPWSPSSSIRCGASFPGLFLRLRLARHADPDGRHRRRRLAPLRFHALTLIAPI